MAESDTRILVVDDEIMMAELVQDTVRELDIRAHYAKDGLEALWILRAGVKFSLMITDLEMENMGGEKLIAEVARSFRGLPILVFSGSNPGPSKIRHLRGLGAREVLSKPMPVSDLEEAIRRHLNRPVVEEKAVI